MKSRFGSNLSEERKQGRRRAELDPLFSDLRDLISAAGADVAEKARRERLLRHLEPADNRTRWNWQSTAGSELERFFGDRHQTMTLPISNLNRREETRVMRRFAIFRRTARGY